VMLGEILQITVVGTMIGNLSVFSIITFNNISFKYQRIFLVLLVFFIPLVFLLGYLLLKNLTCTVFSIYCISSPLGVVLIVLTVVMLLTQRLNKNGEKHGQVPDKSLER